MAPGDTLAAIAARHGLGIETLLSANPLPDPALLRPGHELRVPAVDGLLYVVQAGDTLRALAERFGIPLREIIAANGLADPDRVATGTELLVPGATLPTLARAPQSEEAVLTALSVGALVPIPPSSDLKPRGLRVHVVAPGDALASIAETYGLSVPTLLWANGLRGRADTIAVNEQLLIPSADGAVYTVSEGESLHDIAALFRIPYQALLDANDYSNPDLVGAGSWLVVPGVDPQLGQAPPAEQPGQAFAAATGQKPLAAQPRATNTVYEVQPGDTLASLANKFGVDLKTILAANGIADRNLVRVGAKLTILPASGLEHTVQPGETLADIARRYRTDLGVIIDFNGIADPDVLLPGATLILPGAREPIGAAPAPKPATAPAPRPAAPPPPPAPVPASSVGQTIANYAAKFEGYPYVWGGTSPAGFDCSGLVYYVFQQVGKPVPRGIWGQYNAGRHVSRDQLQPGDIVFFQNTYMPGLSHNGIYLGGGRFVHAVDESKGVRISNMSDAYWASRWFGATRP